MNTILVAIDFSDDSRLALRRALEIADRFDAKVTLVHAIDLTGLRGAAPELYVDIPSLAARIRDSAEAGLREIAAAEDPEGRRIVAAEVYEGRPANAIVEAAREKKASLIVTGTHGRTGLSRMVLGSVAERVVRHAPCDVLVVRPRQAGDSHEAPPSR